MPIQTQDLLLRLNPNGMMPEPSAPSQGSGLERQRLKLMREQFTETKRSNLEDERLRQLSLEGQLAQHHLMAERERAQLEAQKAAKTQADRLAAYDQFTKLNGSGDIEGARAMVPMMTALGMGVDLEGEEGGLPRYRVEMDGQAADQQEGARAAQASPYGPGETSVQSLDRMSALGYPMNDSGGMNEPAGITSTGQADSSGLTVAERVASTYGEPGEKTPMVGSDEEDYTGGVPNNVLDMGAINAQSLRRLNPALSGIVAGMPEEYQGSARQTASGIGGLGLPATKAVELFGKQQGDANTLISKNLEAEREAASKNLAAERERAKAEYAQRFQTDKEGFDRYDRGFNQFAPEVAKSFDVTNRKKQRDLNNRIQEILTNTVKEDDLLVLGGIVRGLGEVGAPSDADAARAVGAPATSTWNQIADWITSRTEGGMPEQSRKALTGVIKKSIATNDAQLSAYGDRMVELINDPETDPEVARALRQAYRFNVPVDLQKPEMRAAAGRRGADDSAGTVTGEVVIPDSSRIAKAHNNPGNLKFVDQEGATKGEPADDGGSWAKFDSPEAGLEALRQQIEKDAGRGQTVREFVTKYAPPGSNDTEKYIEQAATALRAKADDLLSDVDTFDVLRFVADKESGTKLPSQYDDADAKAMGEQTAAETAAATPAADSLTPEEQAELTELKKRFGK